MTTLPIPPELAGYSVDILRAELTRREEISELKCALANYLQDLKRCADAAKLNRDFTSSCIEWLDSDVDTIAESMYMNSGVRAARSHDMNRRVEKLSCRLFQLALNGQKVGLNLPAVKSSAVVGQRQLEVPHAIRL